MRSPRSFMARSSWVVTGLVSSAIGNRARRRSGLELRQLALPEGTVRKLGVRDHELRLPLGHAGMVNELRDAGKAAGQLPQHRRHLLELSSRALEVSEPPRRFVGARRDVIRLGTVLPRDFGDGVDALAQLAEGLV